MRRVVIVDDKMQQGYRYELSAPVGCDFDPQFRPELTPKQMLELGVFCGKDLTDCRDECPASWFVRAKLSPSARDCSLNYFRVDASQPFGVAMEGLDACGLSARLVPVVLPLLHGPAAARRGRPPDWALEGDEAPRVANQETLRAGRSDVPAAPLPSALAMGETRKFAAILVADVVGYSRLADADKDRRELFRCNNPDGEKDKSDRP
jgi:hypothetical protein